MHVCIYIYIYMYTHIPKTAHPRCAARDRLPRRHGPRVLTLTPGLPTSHISA